MDAELPNFSETVESFLTCELYVLYFIIPLLVKPLNSQRIDEMVAEDKAAGDMSVPDRLGRQWSIWLMENAMARCHILYPTVDDGAFDTIIFYLHGGAYIANFNDPLHFDGPAKIAAQLGHCSLFLVEYPRAPSVSHGDLFDMVEGLFKQVAERYANNKIVVMGDSAGAGLALVVSQRLVAASKRETVRLPDSIILQSPWLDLSVSDPESARLESVDPILRVEGLRKAGELLAAGIPLSDPRISPLFGDLSGLPPVSVWIGSHDVLLPDSRRLRDRFKTEKIPSRFRYREKLGLLHCFFLLPFNGSAETIDEVVDAIIEDCSLARTKAAKKSSILCGF